MDIFKASAHYGDWKGTVAADNADPLEIHNLLRAKGLIKKTDFLIGLHFSIAEKLGVLEQPPHIKAFLLEGLIIMKVLRRSSVKRPARLI